MTHKALVNRMVAYLRFGQKIPVVIRELSTSISEQPDVIGFTRQGVSTLIECKMSRDDFRADKIKWFRQNEEAGIGDLRYYACPPGVLKPEDMPPGWGLIIVEEKQNRRLVIAEHKQADKKKEVAMLTSTMRRLQLSTAVFVELGEQ